MRSLLVPLVVASVIFGSCATTARVANLERRIAAMETADRQLREALAWSLEFSAERVLEQKTKAFQPVSIPSDGSWSIGPIDAAVVVVEFSDMECLYSAQISEAMKELIGKFGDNVRFVFKHFPLDTHKNARLAHAALLAAGNQGHFWDYRFLVQENFYQLSEEMLSQIARDLKLDMPRFMADWADDDAANARIDRDIALGKKINVPSTPAIYVNGLRVGDPVSAIEAALQGKEIQPDNGDGGNGCGA